MKIGFKIDVLCVVLPLCSFANEGQELAQLETAQFRACAAFRLNPTYNSTFYRDAINSAPA